MKKIVRDLIPTIIRNSGGDVSSLKILPAKEFAKQLVNEKIVEEMKEFQRAVEHGDYEGALAEAGDVLEVMISIIGHMPSADITNPCVNGVSVRSADEILSGIHAAMVDKFNRRGGFAAGFVMEFPDD